MTPAEQVPSIPSSDELDVLETWLREGRPLDQGRVADTIAALRAALARAEKERADIDRLNQQLLTRAQIAEQERDALRADAERYRWLREQSGIITPKASTVFRKGDEWANVWDGLSLDAAIDAARQAAGEKD